jgi:hypothetical protein
MKKRIPKCERWVCAKCRRVYGASEGYHETARGTYWCERCSAKAGKELSVRT